MEYNHTKWKKEWEAKHRAKMKELSELDQKFKENKMSLQEIKEFFSEWWRWCGFRHKSDERK